MEKGRALLRCSDNVCVAVEMEFAMKMSPKIRDKLRETMAGYEHEGDKDITIPLPLVSSEILQLAIEWVEWHKDKPVYNGTEFVIRAKDVRDWPQWEQDFANRYSASMEDLQKAAWYLKMKPLWIACRIVCDPKDVYFWHTYVARYNATAEWNEEGVNYTH